MSTLISAQQLINAGIDAETLEQIVNGDSSQSAIPLRLGGTAQSLRNVLFSMASSGNNFSVVPTGNIDGTNTVFTLPVAPRQLSLYLNGQFQSPNGIDYTLNGTQITYNVAPQPPTQGTLGDKHYAQGLY